MQTHTGKEELDSRPGILISYDYMKGGKEGGLFLQALEALRDSVCFLIDSGAFTDHNRALKAVKAGQPVNRITIEEYIAWCLRHVSELWGYFSLDVIGNAQGTKANLIKMLDAGLRPIPVVHGLINQEEFDFYFSNAPDQRLGAGGIAGKQKGKRSTSIAYYFYHRLYKLSGDRAKLHALGFFKYPQILRLPIRTLDSFTWRNGVLYGNLTIYRSRHFERISSPYEGAAVNDVYTVSKRLELLHQHGVSIEDFDNHARGYFNFPGYVTTYAYLRAERFLLRNHDLRYFFVVTSVHHFMELAAVVLTSRYGQPGDYKQALSLFYEMKDMPFKEMLDILVSCFSNYWSVEVGDD